MAYDEGINQIWQAVAEQFRAETQVESTWNLWFGDVVCTNYDDVNKIITLTCANNLKLDVLRTRYLASINERFAELLGIPVTVVAVCRPDYKEPVPAEDAQKQAVAAAVGNNVNAYNFKYTFDNFIQGNSNKFAAAACRAVADHPGDCYNPLFIYGPSGLGKTHLLRAVVNELLQQKPGMRVEYVKCEDFLNEMIASITNSTMNDFHNKYRRCDVLLVDDIQFIDGKEATQDEFFHTFNTLADNHKQVILTSDRPPKDINQLADRLRTRFECGLIADIQPPNLELRIAIIRKKAEQIGTEIPNEVLQYLAENLISNIRQIEGAITKLSALAMVSGSKITLDMAKSCILELLGGAEPVNVTIDKIFKVVENKFGVSKAALLGEKQSKDVAMPRHYAVYLIRKITDISLPNIGKMFNRDHTTVLSSWRKIEKMVRIDPEIAVTIDGMIEEVRTITL